MNNISIKVCYFPQEHKMDRYIEFMGLISIMLLSTAMAGCPSKCICSTNTVKCSGRSLMGVPNFQRLENNPTIIDLSSNDIDFIAYDDLSFDKADVVQILHLNQSKIIIIDDTAFKELINVKEISLANNLLGQLSPNSFEYNNNLILLDLSYNLFRNMPKLRAQSLETLILYNSGIEKVENDNFVGLPSLKYLNLQRNNIKSIPVQSFNDIPNLRLIQLEFNRWKCTCESVKLFNFLQENAVLHLEEPIQCRNNDDLFVSFFTKEGSPEPIKDLCEKYGSSYFNFVGNYVEPKEIFNQRRSTITRHQTNRELAKTKKLEKIKMKNITIPNIEIISNRNKSEYSNNKCEKYYESISSFTVPNYIIFSIAIILSFIVGLALGCLFVSSKNRKSRDNSSSWDSLLKGKIAI